MLATLLALVLLAAAAGRAHEPADTTTCSCATLRQADGWCGLHERGRLAGVEIRSRLLYDAMDAHGHELDLSTFECETCRQAIADDGFCEQHRTGFIDELAYFSRLSYEMARGSRRRSDSIACPTCRENVQSPGWCETHAGGMIGTVSIVDRQSWERAAREVEILRRAAGEAERCESCALAMVTRTRCPLCRIAYPDGAPRPEADAASPPANPAPARAPTPPGR